MNGIEKIQFIIHISPWKIGYNNPIQSKDNPIHLVVTITFSVFKKKDVKSRICPKNEKSERKKIEFSSEALNEILLKNTFKAVDTSTKPSGIIPCPIPTITNK